MRDISEILAPNRDGTPSHLPEIETMFAGMWERIMPEE